jgi:hypothetical protein
MAGYTRQARGREMGIDADKALKYRQRAEHLRIVADGITNPESREALLQVAGDY